MNRTRDPEASPWLSTQALAEYLDVSIDTVRAWRYREVGPPGHRVGRHVRYHRDEVDAWARSAAAAVA